MSSPVFFVRPGLQALQPKTVRRVTKQSVARFRVTGWQSRYISWLVCLGPSHMYRSLELDSTRSRNRSASRSRFALVFLIICCSSIAISSCGLRLDDEQLFDRAATAIDREDLPAAIIDLKAVLQRNPEHVEARLMLGQAYLKVAEPLAAEKELRRALDMGMSRHRVVVPLCESLLAQQAYDLVLEEARQDGGLSDDGNVEIHLIRGDAELALGQLEEARGQYVKALERDAVSGVAYLGLASIAIHQGEPERSAQYLERAIEVAPDLPSVWLARGEFQLGLRNPAEAEIDLLRAVSLARSKNNGQILQNALAGLSDIYLINGDLKAASDAVAEMRSTAPQALLTRFSDARVEFSKGEIDSAVQLLQGILKDSPDFYKAHLLYGAVSRAKGNFAQAEMHLSSVVVNWPQNEEARRLLADVQLRQNKFSDAADALEPLLANADADDRLLAAAGVAKMQVGEGGAGLELFERSVEADPDNRSRKLDLVSLYLAAGRTDDAASLILEMESSGPVDGRLSILKLLAMEQSGDVVGALARANDLLTSAPDDAGLLVVAGNLHKRVGNRAAATEALDRAFKLDGSRTDALVALARMEFEAGKLAQARSKYRRALQIAPDDARIMTDLSELAAASGDAATAVSWLEKARATDPMIMFPRIRLVTHYLSLGQNDEAGRIAEETLRINDKDARAHNISGVWHMANGDFSGAVRFFTQAASLAPQVPAYRLNLARAELERGNETVAWKMMRQNYESHPDHIATAMQLAAFYLRRGDFNEATEVAEQLSATFPGRTVGQSLRAEILASQSKFAEAAALYDEVLQTESTRKYAVRAFQLRKSASSSDPYAPLVNYLRDNTNDTAARMQLAEALLAGGDASRAAVQYEKVLAGNPYNLIALNNLAWILVEENGERAREFAKIAYDIMPSNSAIVDTYGYVLMKLGEVDEAVDLLRSAAATMPDSTAIRKRLDEAMRQLPE